MERDRNTYSSILHAIALFGGVRIFQIIISIVRSKAIAILIGPVGMGITGLYTSTIEMIGTIVGLGLNTSGVKEISNSFARDNQEEIGKTISVIRKIVIFTGIVGALLTFLFAPYLSIWTFGSDVYTSGFRALSIVILFNELNVGQITLLQGTFNYRYLAKSTLYGNLIGLIITLPLYYSFGVEAIVPSLVIASALTLSYSFLYSRRIHYKKISISVTEAIGQGKPMILLGISLVISGFVTTLSSYLLRIVISHYGTVSDLGLYTAGMSLTTMYVMTILSSMGTDYAPRLAACLNDKEMTDVINKQAILLLTIVTPLIILFLSFCHEAILILYTSEFLPMQGMLYWVMLGMFFRTFSWSMSYSLVAHGDTKMFLINEIIMSVLSFVMSSVGFIYYSIIGMGMAFCFVYVIYTIMIFFTIRHTIHFEFSIEGRKYIFTYICFVSLSFSLLYTFDKGVIHYLIGAFLSIISILYTYQKLRFMIKRK